MALLNSVPIPLGDPIAQRKRKEFGTRTDPLEGLITRPWADWMTQQNTILEQAATRIKSVSLTNQSAAIGATDFSGGALSAGLYQVTYYARITQAATTSSSLTVTFDWTDGAASPSFSGAAITGNTTSTIQSETKLIRIANLSPVRYSTAYTSVGAQVMKYSLDFILTEISA
jgi:hypothetical protein